MIMDGATYDVGSVGCLRNIKNAISVARAIMDYSDHSLLVGDQATNFAVEMGFERSDLSTPGSIGRWENWKAANCQPNYRRNVLPDPKTSCGPYSPLDEISGIQNITTVGHDTIGMVAIDSLNNIASGTSTNGMSYKIPGRVGDSPIVGSGSYADNSVGGCAATGNGDIMMRFLPCFNAIEHMRSGLNPTQAAEVAINLIKAHFPSVAAGVVTIDKNGDFGAACLSMGEFPFSVINPTLGSVRVFRVKCL